jgi:hypothetical protein
MPKKSIDYSNTTIYKIVCNDLTITDLYVGHTTNFRQRKSTHKNVCFNKQNKKHNCKVYRFIRENGDWKNWTIVEARALERGYIETLTATLNYQIPGRTQKERCKKYNLENKDKIREYNAKYRLENREANAKYYLENKDENRETQAKYYLENKDKNREYCAKYRLENRERKKEANAKYKLENKDKIREYKAKYYLENK